MLNRLLIAALLPPAALLGLAILAAPASAQAPLWPALPVTEIPHSLPAAARTCKQVSSCEEAVRLWCGGYRRADADRDGIPCENVCRTKAEVDAIRKRIGC